MIERETVAPEERRLVSAVIYNRLERDMVLGIDATLRYASAYQAPGHLRRRTSRVTRPTTHAASRAFRRPRSATRDSPRSVPPQAPRPSTTCTTSASQTASTISSPPTKRSSVGRHASMATAVEQISRAVSPRRLRSGSPSRASHLEARLQLVCKPSDQARLLPYGDDGRRRLDALRDDGAARGDGAALRRTL